MMPRAEGGMDIVEPGTPGAVVGSVFRVKGYWDSDSPPVDRIAR
jgi:hypothetical protein